MKKLLTIKAEDFLKHGIGLSEYTDLVSPFRKADGIDPFKTPGILQEAFTPTQIGAAQVADNIRWFSPYVGTNPYLFAYGDAGKIYRINTVTDVVELLQTTANSSGQGFAHFKSAIYYAQNTQLGKMTNIEAATPTFADNFGTGLENVSNHPLWEFQGRLYVGNKNIVGFTDGTTLTKTGTGTLTLPDDFEIVTICDNGFHLIIGATKKQGSFTRNISKIFWWDSYSSNWSYEAEIPDGSLSKIAKTVVGLLAFTGKAVYPLTTGLLGAPIIIATTNGNVTGNDLLPSDSGVSTWCGMTIWKAYYRILCFGRIHSGLPNILTNPFVLTNLKAIEATASDRVYASTTDGKLYNFKSGALADAQLETGYIEMPAPYEIQRVKVVLANPFGSGDSLRIELTNEDYGTVPTLADITLSYAVDGGTLRSFIKPISIEGNYLRLIAIFNGGISFKKIEFWGDYHPESDKTF